MNSHRCPEHGDEKCLGNPKQRFHACTKDKPSLAWDSITGKIDSLDATADADTGAPP
jgi:hypothetical protein